MLFNREHSIKVFVLDRPVKRLPELAVALGAATAFVATENVEGVRVSSIHEPIPAALARLRVAQRRSLVARSTAARDAAEVEGDAFRHLWSGGADDVGSEIGQIGVRSTN